MLEVPPNMPFFYASKKKFMPYLTLLCSEDTRRLMAVRGAWLDLICCFLANLGGGQGRFQDG